MISKKRRNTEEVNSSSMADIAFLLLVFFLVTTTISMDKGITLVLPAEGNELEVNQNNIVNILVNEVGKVLIDDKPTKMAHIKARAERKIASNPNIVSELGKAFCNGLKQTGILPVLKHIPGH